MCVCVCACVCVRACALACPSSRFYWTAIHWLRLERERQRIEAERGPPLPHLVDVYVCVCVCL